MSFKESIILPVELFEKCHFQTEDDDSAIASLDKQIPSDVKMKVYSHSKRSKIKTPSPEPKTSYIGNWTLENHIGAT